MGQMLDGDVTMNVTNSKHDQDSTKAVAEVTKQLKQTKISTTKGITAYKCKANVKEVSARTGTDGGGVN